MYLLAILFYITGLTDGQIVGIIIGALSLVALTVIIIITAVIVLFKQRNKRLGCAGYLLGASTKINAKFSI